MSKTHTASEEKINGRYIVHHKEKRDENGRFIIGASITPKNTESSNMYSSFNIKFCEDIIGGDAIKIEDKEHKKKKMKKSPSKLKKADGLSKKDKKNRKKKAKAAMAQLDYENKAVNNGSVMADIIRHKEYLRVVCKDIYVYDDRSGLFKLYDKQSIGTALCHFLDKKGGFMNKVTSAELTECYKMLLVKEELQCAPLCDGSNTPYILCENGVVNLNELKLKEFSPEYEFTSAIQAKYDENAEGHNFKKFLDFVTCGDKELKRLLQEVTGYILSNYSCMRSAFMFLGPKGTGKSLYLSLVRELIGMENTSSVNLQDLECEYYRANILKAKVNIAPDIPSDPIRKEISTFKSLTSNLDVISGRDPREKPIQRVCNTRLVFGSNENIQLVGVSAASIEAFFDRMIYLPFLHQISYEERDLNLKGCLIEERDYIFTWACKGMNRVINNGFHFSICHASESMKAGCWGKYCPEQVFCKEHIEFADDDTYASSKEIKNEFKEFCQKVNATVVPDSITGYLENTLNIKKSASKKRIDSDGHVCSKGNPISVYQGIRLI